MALQNVDMLRPEAHSCTVSEKSQKVKSRLVLQHVNAVSKAHNALTRSHNELTSNEIRITEITVVAGIKNDHSGIRSNLINLLQNNTGLKIQK